MKINDIVTDELGIEYKVTALLEDLVCLCPASPTVGSASARCLWYPVAELKTWKKTTKGI